MYAVLDIETTGGKYNEEGITEIAIHKFDGHQVTDTFISLVNPEKPIQPFVVNLTGINNKMLRTAPKFHEIAKRIIEITQDAVLIAHNAQFDYRILRTEFRRLGYNFERKTLCTVDLAKQLIPDRDSYSLGKLVRSLGIPVSDRHRANGDALATLKLFKLLLAKDTSKTIITETTREASLGELSPTQLDIVAQMPSETGVYYMHNREGEIIFLGKSTNIKKKINQHFTKIGQKARKLQKETKKVSYEHTGSELVALLKENEELLKNKPRYNVNHNRSLFTHGLYVGVDEQGYQTLRIAKYDSKLKPVSTFNSIHSAKNLLYKVTKEFLLCPKMNGLSEAKTNCSNYEEQQCYGACVGKENPETYNQRVQDCIAKYSLEGKSFIIVDKGRALGEHSAVLVKNGSFNGLGFYDLNHQINKIHILQSIITPMEGSANANYIIESYLRKRKNFKILELNS